MVGGAGYIGSILCRQLIRKGHRVRVLDSLIYGDAAIRDLLGDPQFELQQGDCRLLEVDLGVTLACTGPWPPYSFLPP